MQYSQHHRTGLRIKPPIHSTRAKRIAETASRLLLIERINFTRRKKEYLIQDTSEAEQELQSVSDESSFAGVMGWSKKRAHNVFWNTKDKQKRKFDRLMHQQTLPSRVHQHQKKKVVVNLSKRELSKNEEHILSLGMKFAITSKGISTDAVIAGTESPARYLCLETAMEVRRLVKKCLMMPNHQNPTWQGIRPKC